MGKYSVELVPQVDKEIKVIKSLATKQALKGLKRLLKNFQKPLIPAPVNPKL